MSNQIGAVDGIKDRITRRVQEIKALPTTVAVAVRIFELQKDPKAEIADYARIVASDAGITARLLALANSSWVGLSKPITQPNKAVGLLGVKPGDWAMLAIDPDGCDLGDGRQSLRLAFPEPVFTAAGLRKTLAALLHK